MIAKVYPISVPLILLALSGSNAYAAPRQIDFPPIHPSVEVSEPEPSQPTPPTSSAQAPEAPQPSSASTTTTTTTSTFTLQPGDQNKSTAATAQKLLTIAKEYWGAEAACPGGYDVLVNEITDQPAEVDGTNQKAAGEAAMPGCFMRVIPSVWLEDLTLGASAEIICAIVVHEYGHSLGHPHSTDPNSVMNPLTVYTTGMPRQCKELGEVEFAPITITISNTRPKHHHKHHKKRRHRLHRVHIKHEGKVQTI